MDKFIDRISEVAILAGKHNHSCEYYNRQMAKAQSSRMESARANKGRQAVIDQCRMSNHRVMRRLNSFK